jgi:hypothetical protein
MKKIKGRGKGETRKTKGIQGKEVKSDRREEAKRKETIKFKE